MAFTPGWVPEEWGSRVIQVSQQNSVVEQFARRELMVSNLKEVPAFQADAPVVVPEGTLIPDAVASYTPVLLTARKYAKIFQITEEDLNDTIVDTLGNYKQAWATKWARKYDNATLALTVAGDGTDAKPFNSVYYNVSQYNSGSNIIPTAGALTFEDINTAVNLAEQSQYYDAANTVIIAHPKMLGAIRQMQSPSGYYVLPDPVAQTPGNLLGYPLVVSYGAATSATATDTPTGNPLLIVGNRQMMINGVRSPIESAVSREAQFANDGVSLKVRVRRAFQSVAPDAFGIVEITAAP